MESGDKENQIRELNENELNLVGGGIGTGPGGLFSIRNIATAGRFATGIGYLGGAFSFGYGIGTFGYNTYNRYRYNTP